MKLFGEKLIIRVAYIYIATPFIIFIISWLKWYYAAFFSIVILLSLFYSFRETDVFAANNIRLQGSSKKILIAGFLILLWIFFSGIGGYSYQTNDHHWRNAVFNDLIRYEWPVIYHVDGLNNGHPLQGKTCMQAYYIAFWLPAALVGKLFGPHAANFFLFAWAAAGLLLVYYFICRYLGSFSLSHLLIFIFWGTAYSIGLLIKYPPETLIRSEQLLWAGQMYYADNNTGLLYWVFNQSVVPWLVLLLLLNNIPGKNLLFLYSLCAFHGPLAFAGLLPYVIFLILKNGSAFPNAGQNLLARLEKFFSFQNIVGSLSVVLVTFLYFSVNSAKDQFSFLPQNIFLYFVFILASFGVICILLFGRFKREPLYYIAIFILLPLPFLRLGTGLDFCARVSIPSMFVLMLLVMKYLKEEKSQVKKIPVILYLGIGAIVPALQISRSFTLTLVHYTSYMNYEIPIPIERFEKKMAESKNQNILIKDKFKTLKNPENREIRNFMGDTTDHFFCRELMKTGY